MQEQQTKFPIITIAGALIVIVLVGVAIANLEMAQMSSRNVTSQKQVDTPPTNQTELQSNIDLPSQTRVTVLKFAEVTI
jgi:hypothetical protein